VPDDRVTVVTEKHTGPSLPPQLIDRYGSDTVAAAGRFQPMTFARRLEVRDALDPAFTKTWLEYSAGLFTRPHLDVQTRVLVLAAQFTITRHPDRLRETLVFAVHEKLDLRQVLESVLQCYIYGGEVVLDAALETFLSVVDEYGLRERLQATQMPPDGRDAERDLARERAAWNPDDSADPRSLAYLDKYGWLAVSNAMLVRPGWALDAIERYDGVDPDFTRLWLENTYHRMYTRDVLDEKSRLLCMIGGLLAIGENAQSRHHMRSALRCGARPEEILEIAFMGCVLFGHPYMLGGAVRDFLQILEAEGRRPADA
jgi:alkylhydroperoxidase/carboxymuconolactone decarboxylase family protein YurZ